MKHDEAELEIPAHVRGELDEETARRVEAHLASCQGCRATFEAWREMLRDSVGRIEELFGPHPSSAELRRLAREGGRVAPEGVIRHLDCCARCQLELEVWKAGPNVGTAHVPSGTRYRNRSPAFLVAAVLAGIALGAALMSFVAHRSTSPDWEGAPMDLVEVVSPTRSTAEAVTRISTGAPWVGLLLTLDLGDGPRGERPVRFYLVDTEGRQVWSTTAPAARIGAILDSSRIVTVPLPVGRLVPGIYRLQVETELFGKTEILFDSPLEIVGATSP